MPHQCTSCERLFDDGSREMLGGCPRCGGNRFQYLPDGADDEPAADPYASRSTGSADQDPGSPSDHDGGDDSGLIVASGSSSGAGPATDDSSPESTAQADARANMVEADDLPSTSDAPEPDPDTEPDAPVAESAANPPVEELAAELEDAFGSIRIVERGEYELDLMELYENDTCIIQLEEDGRYVIDVPEMFEADPNG